jgi:hypothetical protein
MMINRISFTTEQLDVLRAHLLQNRLEQVAFVFSNVGVDSGVRTFEATDLYLAEPRDFAVQTEYHVELTDDALARVIKMAWNRRMAIVDLHSHPRESRPVCFSASDLTGFSDLVPYIHWRLKGQPYAGIVWAPHSFDSLVWPNEFNAPERLESVISGTNSSLTPTGISYKRFQDYGKRKSI